MGGKSGGNEAAIARQEEQDRQARIRQGTQRINSIFDGGTTVDGRVADTAAFDPAGTYFTADGSQWTMPAADPPAEPARDFRGSLSKGVVSSTPAGSDPWSKAVKEGLYTSRKSGTGFDDAFFDQRKQSYIDYATPQIEEQRDEAGKQLVYAMARTGNLESSARADLAAELQKRYDLQKQKVLDDALNYETQARTGIEDARSSLISTLNATGDAEGAAKSALARASALSQPAAYSPLSSMFADFTDALGASAAAARAREFGWGGSSGTSGTSIYAPRSGSVRVSG